MKLPFSLSFILIFCLHWPVPAQAQTCCPDEASTIQAFAGTGVPGYSGDGGPATLAKLNGVFGLWADPAGNVYISDAANFVVREVSPLGIITTFAGNGTLGYSGDGGPATLAEMAQPNYFTTDPAGDVYMADYQDNVVRKVTPGGIISTYAGTGAVGYTGDGGPATLATLNSPGGLAWDPPGDLLIADSLNHVIREVSPSGIITTFAGTGTGGFSGDGGPATLAELQLPVGVTLDPYTGDIYFGDFSNWRIRKISPSGVISTVAGTGTAIASGNGGPATLAGVTDVHGFAFCNNNIYFTDGQGGIRYIDGSGIVHLMVPDGIASGDGGPASLATILTPNGMAMDGSYNLYVGDVNSYRVRKISPDVLSTSACAGSPTPTATPTIYINIFYVSLNSFTPAQGSVSIFVETNNFPGAYSLKVFNSAGEQIKTLDSKNLSGPFSQSYSWNGTNKYNATCASGVYIFDLEEPFSHQQKRVLWIR